MAKIGLSNLRYGILDESNPKEPKYTGAKSFGKAIECKVNPEYNEGALYADDSLAEHDSSFKKGTITLTIDEDEDKTFAEILGHEVLEDGEVVKKATDEAPYVGIGRILTKLVNGVRKYKVEFLAKTQFKEPAQEDKTAGENIEFGTPTVEGIVMKRQDGIWSRSKTFTSRAEAEAFLKEILPDSLPAQEKNKVASQEVKA